MLGCFIQLSPCGVGVAVTTGVQWGQLELNTMGTVGDALDNAVAESFFASLQCELLDRHHWDTRAELARAMFHYVEAFYNPTRRHSTLGYLSPVDFERNTASAA